tara:strand:- start:4089 stop:4220 length:132 start_codon:yes stop_codon:yes gene_type:complete
MEFFSEDIHFGSIASAEYYCLADVSSGPDVQKGFGKIFIRYGK